MKTAFVCWAIVILCFVPAGAGASTLDPHLDLSLVPMGCSACHRGHGVPRSPMLPGPQASLCLSCHGSASDRERALREGRITDRARPALLATTLSQASVHPVTPNAFSAAPGVVVCTSCHSAHRGRRGAGEMSPGQRKRSPRNDGEFENDLCESCHGSAGPTTASLLDISRLTDPSNASYHPLKAPVRDGSASTLPGLQGGEISCTDCHGNSDPRGPRGPHGSAEPPLLVARHPTVDGGGDSELCYRCHDRRLISSGSSFPLHDLHLRKARAACATCHNPHGSVGNRALIRFGEETTLSGVAPSAKTGRLAFVSDAPGSGACYLTCHGEDHAPAEYGGIHALGGGGRD